MNLYMVLGQHQPGRLYHRNHLRRQTVEEVLAELWEAIVAPHFFDFHVAEEHELGRLRRQPFSAPQMRYRIFVVPQGPAPRRIPRGQGQLSLFDMEDV